MLKITRWLRTFPSFFYRRGTESAVLTAKLGMPSSTLLITVILESSILMYTLVLNTTVCMRLHRILLLGALVFGASLSFGHTAFGQRELVSTGAIKGVTLESQSAIAHVLNDDHTISTYDLSSGELIISHQDLLPQAKNVYQVFGNSDDSKLAVLYNDSVSSVELRVAIFSVPASGGQFIAGPDYLLGGQIDQGHVEGVFSSDSKTLFVTYAKNTLFSLSTSITKQQQTTVGDLPSAIALTDTGMVLVSNEQSGDLSIVDASNLNIRATVKVGTNPSDLIFNTVTKRAYISNSGSDSVSVVDIERGIVTNTLKVGKAPASIAYDETNGAVYVANNSSGNVTIIGPNFSLRSIELNSPAYFKSSPLTLTFRNNDRKLFIVNTSEAKYFVYDVSTSRLITEAQTNSFPIKIFASEKIPSAYLWSWNASSLVTLKSETFTADTSSEVTSSTDAFFSRPQSITTDPLTNRVFVSNVGADYVTVIDGATYKPINKIVVGKSIQNLLLDSVLQKLYAVSPADNAVYVIDISGTAYPVISIKLAQQPRGGAINKKTNTLYYSNSAADMLSVIDGTRNIVTATIRLPADSFPLLNAVDEERNRVYVALYGGNSIAVINGVTNTVDKFISAGGRPIWVRYIPELDLIFSTIENGKKVLVIDPLNESIIQDLPIDGEPYRIFFDTTTKYVYISQRSTNIVYVFRAVGGAGKELELVNSLPIPYWGETDARPYNLVSYNEKTNLAYFTSVADKVVVIQVAHDSSNLLQGIWQATINADGSVTVPQSSVFAAQGVEKYTLWGLIVILLLLILAAIFFWKYHDTHTPPPTPTPTQPNGFS